MAKGQKFESAKGAAKTIAILLAAGLIVMTWVGPVAAEERSLELVHALYVEKAVGDTDKAVELYRQLLAAKKTPAEIQAQATHRLGMCYARQGNHAQAVETLKKMIQTYPRLKELLAQAQNDLNTLLAAPPQVIATSPKAFANDVSPDCKELTVTFDQVMKDHSWSWCGGGEFFPESAGKISYDKKLTTCAMPVKLEPGHAYILGINSRRAQNFRSASGIPAQRGILFFATLNHDGRPTPFPDSLLEEAKSANPRAYLAHLIGELSDPKSSAEACAAAQAQVIGQKETALAMLIGALQADQSGRIALVLGSIGDERAIEPLLDKLAAQKKAEERKPVLEALALIAKQEFGEDFKAWQGWWAEAGPKRWREWEQAESGGKAGEQF